MDVLGTQNIETQELSFRFFILSIPKIQGLLSFYIQYSHSIQSLCCIYRIQQSKQYIKIMLRDKIKDSKNKEKIDLFKSAQNLSYLLEPLEHEAVDSLRQSTQKAEIEPIQTVYGQQFDEIEKQYYLQTKHNQLKKGGVYLPNYRSPYTNKYYPNIPQKQGSYPSPLIRNIEQKGHLMFRQYAKLYYGLQKCISNFFVEENEEDFFFAFYVQKKYEGKEEGFEGIWNSTNIAEIKGDPSKNIGYRVTTSVIYQLKVYDDNGSETLVSGNIKRTKNENKRPPAESEIDEFHLMMIGKMIEENQTFLRQQIQSVFIKKTKEIVDKTRIQESNSALNQRKQTNKQLFASKPPVAQ